MKDCTVAANSFRDTPLGRRIVTVPIVFLGALILIPGSIVILPLAALFDVIRGRVRLPTVRVLLFGLVYLGWEVVAVSGALALWVASGFGLLLGRRWFVQAHRQIQVSWANSLIGTMRRFLRLDLVIDGTDCLTPGPVVVFCRHASIIDTLLPAHVLSTSGGLDLRYVLKHELLWDPALDIVGNRIPNHFVDRSGQNTRAELDKIGVLASGMDANESFTIFPEGSRYTESKRTRAIEKLRETDPELAVRAERLERTMPPRVGGVLTILAATPDIDVVIIAHTGLEGLAGVLDLWRVVPFRHPVQVTMWRVPRADIPADDAGRIDWIYSEWERVDRWIRDHG